MTPEQVAALPVGTEVLVRVKTDSASIDQDGDVRVIASYGRSENRRAYTHHDDIESVAPPKPRPLAVGDKVTVGVGSKDVRTIIAIDGRLAWCRFQDCAATWKLNVLVRVP